MIFVLDNYDSFTYNLVDYIGEVYSHIKIVRNDKIKVKEIEKLSPKAIVISPGPKTPKEAGISIQLVKELGGKIPILGVCLGHQAIAEACGGRVIQSHDIVHGKTSLVHYKNSAIFTNIENPFLATRYHSLIVERESLPSHLKITATTAEGIIMGIEVENKRNLYGLQFHPESILTNTGKKILHNFIDLACKH